MRYLLDTNIISNVTKPNPSTALLAWMEAQADDGLFISALTRVRGFALEKSDFEIFWPAKSLILKGEVFSFGQKRL